MDLDTCAREMVVAPQQHRHEPRPERRRGAPGAEWTILARARQIVMASRAAAEATLIWLANLPYDSRDQLHSHEYQLAMLGLRWDSDPVDDAALAHEIEAARRRRLTSE